LESFIDVLVRTAKARGRLCVHFLAEIFVPADFSSETAAHFVAHLLPEFGAARGTIPFANVMAIEHVEILEDRICIARHRQDAQQFGRGAARPRHFPAAYGIGFTGRQAAQFGHVGHGERLANGRAEVFAELLQFQARNLKSSICGSAGQCAADSVSLTTDAARKW
jgi:hypothetical protein